MADLDIKRGRELVTGYPLSDEAVAWLINNAPALLDAVEENERLRHRVGDLMQPRPEDGEEGCVWKLMQHWCEDRRQEKDELRKARARIAELEAERATAADAWDEGYEAAEADAFQRHFHGSDIAVADTPNPYRSTPLCSRCGGPDEPGHKCGRER